ncbi:MAG TPA: hypothetical protein IAC14_08955 [Candidatus Scybalomonas excrementigallinarum]|nr:hypothetical protein [Candidatus Scybalomonas excrementigallinarum]
MKEYNLNIKIDNIKVDERYYSFDYIIKLKDEELKGNYENDYCNGNTKEEWENYLKNSDFCLKTILEDVAYDLGK